jgi:ribosomal protein S6E (S10)
MGNDGIKERKCENECRQIIENDDGAGFGRIIGAKVKIDGGSQQQGCKDNPGKHQPGQTGQNVRYAVFISQWMPVNRWRPPG